MRKHVSALRTLNCVLAMMMSLVAVTTAQTVSGRITGTVIDESGSAIAGATVTLTNDRTNDSRTTTTNSDGTFLFPAIQPGAYSVKVEQKGFSAIQRQGNMLTAAEALSVGTLTLKVGNVAETVTTTAEGTPVQTESTEHSALITAKQLEQVSIIGRDVTALLRVLPGVSLQGQSQSAGNSFGSGIPNIQGGRNTSATMNVDGVRGNDLGSPSTFSSTINFDAIGEVKVLLNGFQAEYASNSNASINIITKSGSSEYRGSAYYYKRHEQFNAKNFFNNLNNIPKPRYRFNTLGATIGGPVWLPKLGNNAKIKDKLFFFYSWENSGTLNPQALRTVTVPTELERNGDFSKSVDVNNAAILIRDPQTGQNFANNIVPANRINKNGQALLKVFPNPNALDRTITRGNYNYTFQESLNVPKWQHLFRTDYKMSEKDNFYVRGSMWYADNQGIAVPAGTANWGLAGLHYTYTDNGITGNWTRIISPSLVNESSIGVRHGVEKGPPLNDTELGKLQKSTYGFTLGQFFPGINPLGFIPQASFGGVTGAAAISYDGRTPLRGADTFISFTDNLSYTRGRHIFKTGLYAERVRNYEGATATFAGNFAFARDVNNPFDSNYAYSNALLGNFQSYTESSARPSGEGRQSIVEFFVQDSWKVRRNFSIEGGVRFSWYNQWYQSTGKSAAFSLERYDRSKAPTFYQPGCTVAVAAGTSCAAANRRARNPINGSLLPAVLVGAFIPGTGNSNNGMVVGSDESYPRGFRDQQPIAIQPRLGFAWDVKGDGKTAIRGSFGTFNQTRVSANVVWSDVSRNPPIAENPRIFYGNIDTLLSSSGVLFPSNVAGFEKDSQTPVTYNFSLGVQRDIGFGTVVDISYVGAQSRHQQQARNLNTIPYSARFLDVNPQNANPVVANTPLIDDLLRPFPGWGNITYYENAGTSNYNALQVAANRRFTRGLQFGLAYTFSKTMDFTDGDRDGIAFYRPRRIWNYGKAGFDQTHVMVINYTYDIPKLSRYLDHPAIKAVFDNWQISGITAFGSGTPTGIGFTTVDGQDITGGGDGARIVWLRDARLPESKQVPSTLANGATGPVQWFDPTAFARPARGNFGNAPKDVLRLPGTHSWDISLFKNIPLGEGKRYFQYRFEMYNAFNHTQWSGVDTTARFDATGAQVNTNFGRVTTARDPRLLQMSLRLTF